jgi:ATP-dependent protease ClpP protease subunit
MSNSPVPVLTLDGLDLIDPAIELAQRTNMTLGSGVDPFARRLYLIGEISTEILYRFLAAFQVLDSTDGAIQIILASPGGSEVCGWAIYDAICMAHNSVVIDVYGAAFSIAALILQAGTYRRLAPNARFMIHNGSIIIEGGIGANEVVGMGEEVRKNSENYAKALQERSNLTLKEVETLCRAETFLGAEEAIKHGFADGTIPSQKNTKRDPVKKKKGKKVK